MRKLLPTLLFAGFSVTAAMAQITTPPNSIQAAGLQPAMTNNVANTMSNNTIDNAPAPAPLVHGDNAGTMRSDKAMFNQPKY